jgi:hypothetical protein
MDEPERTDLVHFPVIGIKGLYVPFVGGFIRLIAPEDLPQARQALERGRKAWLN